jgi:hypothetical protein
MKKRKKNNKRLFIMLILIIIIIVILKYLNLINNNVYNNYYVVKNQRDILSIEDSYYNINTYKKGTNKYLYQEIKFIIPSIRTRVELKNKKIYKISELDNKDIILSIIRPIIGSKTNTCLSLEYINEKTYEFFGLNNLYLEEESNEYNYDNIRGLYCFDKSNTNDNFEISDFTVNRIDNDYLNITFIENIGNTKIGKWTIYYNIIDNNYLISAFKYESIN